MCVVQHRLDEAWVQQRHRLSDGFIQQRSDVLFLIPVSRTEDHHAILEKEKQQTCLTFIHLEAHSVKRHVDTLPYIAYLSFFPES